MTIDAPDKSDEQIVDLPRKAEIPLSFGDSTLLEKLHGVLVANNISGETAHEIKSSLLTILGSGVEQHSLTDIHKISQRCTKCPEMNHDAALPKWNTTSPKVVFVLENQTSLNPAGKELFVNSLMKYKFSSDDCCLTYITRCSKEGAINTEEISNCTLQYLFTEIQLMKPSLIVTFGSVATKAFLGSEFTFDKTSTPKVRWLGPWAILSCPSPNYSANKQTNSKTEFLTHISHARDFIG